MKRGAAILLLSFCSRSESGSSWFVPFAFRNWLGKVTGRGELQVLVRHKGLYDRDVARAWKTELYLRGGNASEVEDPVAREEKKAALERLDSSHPPRGRGRRGIDRSGGVGTRAGTDSVGISAMGMATLIR